MKILQCVRLFLESFDIFAAKPADIFTVKKSFYYSTASTKFFSLLMTFLSIFYFAYSVRDVYLHTNPDIRFYESYMIDQTPVKFGNENNYIAFGLQNKNGTIFFDQSFFEMEMKLYNENGVLWNIELESCDGTNKTEEFKVFLNNIQAPQFFYCLKNYSSLELKGTWDSRTFIYTDLLIKPCNSTKGDKICKDSSEMAKLIKGSSLVMKYGTFTFDPFDYDNPLKTIVGEYSAPMGNQEQPLININFARLHLQDKNKMSSMDSLQPDLTYRNGILFSSERYYINRRNNDSDPFLYMAFQLDKTEKIILRIYDTWIDVLSRVGGFLSFIKLAFNILLTRYVRAALIQRVSNDIFDYKKIFAELEAGNPSKLQQLNSFKLKLSFWTYIKSLCWCICFSKKKEKERYFLTQ